MTGLERLRELAMRHARTGNALTATTIKDIADQIEREQGDAAAALREFAECNGFNPEAEPRDLLAKAAGSLHSARIVADLRYPAWEWVEEHGGLERVKRQRRESVPREAYERKRRAWLGQIAECEAALGKRNARIAELEDALKLADRQAAEQEDRTQAMLPRLMPEGMEWLLDVWPKWSNGEYCKFGDWWKAEKYGEREPQQLRRMAFFTPEQLREWGQDEGENFGYEWDYMRPSDTTYRPDKVEPPAPKVLDADGVEIRVGDTVWIEKTGDAATVKGFSKLAGKPCAVIEVAGCEQRIEGYRLTHRAPVLAADGRPLREGETVWGIGRSQHEFEVLALNDVIPEVGNRFSVKCFDRDDDEVCWCDPNLLTHQRSVLDAGGEPINEGDTVWMVDQSDSDLKFTVANVLAPNEHSDGKWSVKIKSDWGVFTYREPSQLTHTKPEPADSIDMLARDIMNMAEAWHSKTWLVDAQLCASEQVGEQNMDDALDSIARRCKALAERGVS